MMICSKTLRENDDSEAFDSIFQIGDHNLGNGVQ